MAVLPNEKERRTQLLRQAQQGDRAAYESLLKESLPMVRAYIRKRISSPDAVEDLTQQVFLRVHLYRASCTGAFDGWLFTIARHVLFDHLGAAWKAPLEEEEEGELAPAQEKKLALEEAFGRLNDESRRAVLLTKVDGLDTKEAALREGITESALKVRVHRALKNLRKNLWVDS